jgi:tetratricopeptide (TPR) repeat protein
MDQEIGRLKEAVDKHANPAGTVWILVGDHGEAVEGEHGEHTHGVFIFDPTMRVPFIVSAPAVKHPGREIIDVTVSNTDVMPTALGLLGIDIPKDLDGVDLSGAVQGRKISRPPVFMAAWDVAQRFGYHPEYGAVDGTLKLIDTPKPLLFDVAKDPRESRNLLDEAPEARARLSKVVKETLDRMELGASSSASPDVAQQLVALGYVESTYSLKEHSDIDAKDKTDVILRLERIRAMARSNSPARDVEIAYRELIEKEPTFLEARIGLAHALEQQRKFDEALTVYERALERHGGSTVLRSSYSSCLGMARRFEEAIAETRKVLEQVPNDGLARSALLRLLSDAGRPAEAIAQAKAWLEENPEDRQVQAQLGIEYARARDYEVAEPLLRKSLADGEPRLFVRRFLGQITLNRGDFAEAVQHFQAELEWFPVRMETHIELAGAWLLMEKWEEAASEYRFVAEYDPRSYRARLLWAQAVFNGGDYKLADEVLAPALRAAPEDPDVLLLQANILAKLGRRDEGKALFDKARTFDQKRKQAMKDDLSTFTPASRP